MNIKGKYFFKNEFHDCNLTIKHGKIQEFNISNGETLYLYGSKREHSDDYEIEKHYDPKNSPYNSNYVLKYFGGSEKPTLIFLKLNCFEIFRLKFAMQKMLIQSKDIKIDILKYLITALLSFFAGSLYQRYQNENQKLNNNKKETVIKTKENKILKNND